MKTIEEYIQENTLYDVIKRHILFHIDIQEKIINPFSYINESLGSFNNVGKVSEYVFNILKDNGKENILKDNDKENILKDNDKENVIIDSKKFKVYFDELIIDIERSNVISGSYVKQENRKVYIELRLPEKLTYEHYDDFMFIMIHELMHGYEDKRRIAIGKPSIFDLLDDNYVKAFKSRQSINQLFSTIGSLKYLLNDQERNAYFGTLDNIIKTIIEKNNITKDNIKYNELIDEIKNEKIFKSYFDLCSFIIDVNNDNITDNDKSKIEDIYKNYYKENITYNNFVKLINKKWNRFYSKFNQLVPKIICKYIVKPSKRTYDVIK